MKSSLKYNVLIGMTAFLITGLFSFANNTWQLSLFRAGIGFLLFFTLGNILFIFLYQKISKNASKYAQDKIANVKSKALKEKVEDLPLVEQVDDIADEPVFQAIPLQSLHNGEEASN